MCVCVFWLLPMIVSFDAPSPSLSPQQPDKLWGATAEVFVLDRLDKPRRFAGMLASICTSVKGAGRRGVYGCTGSPFSMRFTTHKQTQTQTCRGSEVQRCRCVHGHTQIHRHTDTHTHTHILFPLLPPSNATIVVIVQSTAPPCAWARCSQDGALLPRTSPDSVCATRA